MTPLIPLSEEQYQARTIAALKAEVSRLRIAYDRADGALADAETVPAGNLERGIRALTAERDGLRGQVARLVAALDACEATRGRFSCSYPHDNRCPKARADRPEDWRGIWQCECGAEELEAVITGARAALARPLVQILLEKNDDV